MLSQNKQKNLSDTLQDYCALCDLGLELIPAQYLVQFQFTAHPLCCVCPKITVLVSAGIEIIFFLVAVTVLCFGFSVRILLITR